MIMTGTMDIAPVRQAYAESKDKDTGDACFKMLMKMLADRKRELEKIVMTAENYKDQRLTVGDIILIPGDKYDDDATSVLHHVVLVIADTGSDGPDSTEVAFRSSPLLPLLTFLFFFLACFRVFGWPFRGQLLSVL